MRQPRQFMPKRWATRALALLVAVLLLAAGCDGSDSDDDGFDGTVRLGAALSETGRFAMEGSDSRQGYDTWVRWVNAEYGGIRIGNARYRAEIIYYDDESDADIAAELVQQLIDDDKVDFLLGPYSSSLTSTASAVTEANDVIMLEGNGTSDTLFDRGFRNLFLVATAATDYTQSGIEALAAQGARTAVIAHEDTPFATSVAAGAHFGTAADYADYYESLWGERPVYQAASSTAAALALHLAIEAADSLDADDVRQALRELDVETFYGPIRFDDRGVNVAKPMGTVQVQDGQIVVVAPAAAATGGSSIRRANGTRRCSTPCSPSASRAPS